MNILFRATIAAMIGSISMSAMEAPLPMIDKSQTRSKSHYQHFNSFEDNLLTQSVEEQLANGQDKCNIDFVAISDIVNTKASSNKKLKPRSPRQLQSRWNYLHNVLNKGPWTPWEDAQIIKLHQEFGPQWARMKKFLIKRSVKDIKNRWCHILMQKQEKQKDDDKLSVQQPEMQIDFLSSLLIENLLNPPKPTEGQVVPDLASGK